MIALLPILALLLAATITFLTNSLLLRPWRRARDKHWSEQARLLYPARVAAQYNLFYIPVDFTLIVVLLSDASSALWILTAIASVVGTVLGNLPMSREVFPRISTRQFLHQAAVGWILRFILWFVFLSVAILMPDEFNLLALWLGLGVLALWLIWARLGGLIWVGKKLGLFVPAPDRLQKIANETSVRLNVPFREVLLMRIPVAQAYALPGLRKLLFTDRILEILPDPELSAVCAHELGHLTETLRARQPRTIRALMFFPWLFFNPLLHTLDIFGFILLSATTILIPWYFRKAGIKLESRADEVARSNQGEPGIYARALLRLYEDSLIPAATALKYPTHPPLYDRLIAAGVTPDFPRPVPARSKSAYFTVLVGLTGLLFALFLMYHLGVFKFPDATDIIIPTAQSFIE